MPITRAAARLQLVSTTLPRAGAGCAAAHMRRCPPALPTANASDSPLRILKAPAPWGPQICRAAGAKSATRVACPRGRLCRRGARQELAKARPHHLGIARLEQRTSRLAAPCVVLLQVCTEHCRCRLSRGCQQRHGRGRDRVRFRVSLRTNAGALGHRHVCLRAQPSPPRRIATAAMDVSRRPRSTERPALEIWLGCRCASRVRRP